MDLYYLDTFCILTSSIANNTMIAARIILFFTLYSGASQHKQTEMQYRNIFVI